MRTKRHTAEKTKARVRRKERVAKSMSGTAGRPRLAVFRSAKHIYAQIVDDIKGVTLAAASTQEKSMGKKGLANRDGAKRVGKLIAERALAKSIEQVCFDRGGF